MKKVLLLTGVLLALAAPIAMAGGVNIAWGTQCFTDGVFPAYAPDGHAATFACASNSSPSTWRMTCSFAANTAFPDFVGNEIYIVGISDDATLPDWWALATGGCRASLSAVAASNDFSAALDNGSGCIDPMGGNSLYVAGSNFVGTNPALGVNMMTLEASVALPLTTPVSLAPNTQAYSLMLIIKNGMTVGGCAGCTSGMTFGLNNLKVAGAGGATEMLYEPISGGNQCLTWNGGSHGCTPPVPARNTTWGQVKSLYR